MKTISIKLVAFLSICLSHPALAQSSYVGISEGHPTGSNMISTKGLIAAYDFSTYTENDLLKDFSTYGNHGEVLRIQETEGEFGGARLFTELTDLIDLPEDSSFNLAGPLTIAVHLQLTTPNLHQHIFTCDDMYVLWTTSANQYRLADTLGHGFTTRVETVMTGSWHSVVAVLSATQGDSLTNDNVAIFIDGIQMGGSFDDVWEPGKLRPIGACLIGATLQGSQDHQALQFEGVIDELLIFSRALSNSEIQVFGN